MVKNLTFLSTFVDLLLAIIKVVSCVDDALIFNLASCACLTTEPLESQIIDAAKYCFYRTLVGIILGPYIILDYSPRLWDLEGSFFPRLVHTSSSMDSLISSDP